MSEDKPHKKTPKSIKQAVKKHNADNLGHAARTDTHFRKHIMFHNEIIYPGEVLPNKLKKGESLYSGKNVYSVASPGEFLTQLPFGTHYEPIEEWETDQGRIPTKITPQHKEKHEPKSYPWVHVTSDDLPSEESWAERDARRKDPNTPKGRKRVKKLMQKSMDSATRLNINRTKILKKKLPVTKKQKTEK